MEANNAFPRIVVCPFSADLREVSLTIREDPVLYTMQMVRSTLSPLFLSLRITLLLTGALI